MTILRKPAAAALAAAVALGGCQTTGEGGGGGGRSAVDSAIGRCLGSAVIGALIGGAIGAAAGGGNRIVYGAGVGAGTGALACAVLTALDQQDRHRIREAQIEAVSLNETRTLAYAGSDGRQRALVVRPRPAPPETTGSTGRLCRYADSQVEIAGAGAAEVPAQLVCRTSAGEWLPA